MASTIICARVFSTSPFPFPHSTISRQRTSTRTKMTELISVLYTRLTLTSEGRKVYQMSHTATTHPNRCRISWTSTVTHLQHVPLQYLSLFLEDGAHPQRTMHRLRDEKGLPNAIVRINSLKTMQTLLISSATGSSTHSAPTKRWS